MCQGKGPSKLGWPMRQVVVIEGIKKSLLTTHSIIRRYISADNPTRYKTNAQSSSIIYLVP